MILTAAESGDFGPPGPVRTRSFFGPLAGPIFGYDLLESRVPDLLESHVPDLLESHVPDLPEYHGPDLLEHHAPDLPESRVSEFPGMKRAARRSLVP